MSWDNQEEDYSAKLVDGKHVYISCSNCDAILMDIYIVRPNEKETWKIRASCPFCVKVGQEHLSKSFPVEIKGGFYQGGYGRIKEDEPDEDIASTEIDSFEINGDIFEFKVIKAGPNARPLYK